jgi:hypothetical protein
MLKKLWLHSQINSISFNFKNILKKGMANNLHKACGQNKGKDVFLSTPDLHPL